MGGSCTSSAASSDDPLAPPRASAGAGVAATVVVERRFPSPRPGPPPRPPAPGLPTLALALRAIGELGPAKKAEPEAEEAPVAGDGLLALLPPLIRIGCGEETEAAALVLPLVALWLAVPPSPCAGLSSSSSSSSSPSSSRRLVSIRRAASNESLREASW